jgi:hypothetical protein
VLLTFALQMATIYVPKPALNPDFHKSKLVRGELSQLLTQGRDPHLQGAQSVSGEGCPYHLNLAEPAMSWFGHRI